MPPPPRPVQEAMVKEKFAKQSAAKEAEAQQQAAAAAGRERRRSSIRLSASPSPMPPGTPREEPSHHDPVEEGEGGDEGSGARVPVAVAEGAERAGAHADASDEVEPFVFDGGRESSGADSAGAPGAAGAQGEAGAANRDGGLQCVEDLEGGGDSSSP